MIARLWRGWTTGANSERYASLLATSVLPELIRTAGCRGAYVFKRATEAAETEYSVLMLFEDIPAVKLMAGADYERAVVPTEARTLLTRYDKRATHFDVVAHITQPVSRGGQGDGHP